MAIDNSVVVVETPCPRCAHRLNRASHVSMTETFAPRKGDATICIHCASILLFIDDDGRVRAANAHDIADLMKLPEQWAEIEKAQLCIPRNASAGARMTGYALQLIDHYGHEQLLSQGGPNAAPFRFPCASEAQQLQTRLLAEGEPHLKAVRLVPFPGKKTPSGLAPEGVMAP